MSFGGSGDSGHHFTHFRAPKQMVNFTLFPLSIVATGSSGLESSSERVAPSHIHMGVVVFALKGKQKDTNHFGCPPGLTQFHNTTHYNNI